jgi:hypothetical protein
MKRRSDYKWRKKKGEDSRLLNSRKSKKRGSAKTRKGKDNNKKLKP